MEKSVATRPWKILRISQGPITPDAGALLLRRVERRLSLFDQVADCFTDHRDPDRIQHSLRTLIAQRIVAIALGYEDLNDHDQLRHDPLMALFSENRRGDSTPLAGKSTLNRLKLTPSHPSAANSGEKCGLAADLRTSQEIRIKIGGCRSLPQVCIRGLRY